MSSPRFEVPSGTIDGVNAVFSVSMPYGPGSVAVFINGQLMERSLDDGWEETDPSAGTVTLKEAPRSSGACPDVIQIFYLDTAAPLPETQIFKLKGRIRCPVPLRGTLTDAQALQLADHLEEIARLLELGVAAAWLAVVGGLVGLLVVSGHAAWRRWVG